MSLVVLNMLQLVFNSNLDLLYCIYNESLVLPFISSLYKSYITEQGLNIFKDRYRLVVSEREIGY